MVINWENYRDWLRSDSIVATFLKDGGAEFVYICLSIFIIILSGVVPFLYWQKKLKQDKTSKIKFIKYTVAQSISVIIFLFMSFIPTWVTGYVAGRDIHGRIIPEWEIKYLYQETGDFLPMEYEGWFLLLIILLAITTCLLFYFLYKDDYFIQACLKQHPNTVFTELKLCALSYRRICNDGVAEKINKEYIEFWNQWVADRNHLVADYIRLNNGQFYYSTDGKVYLPGVKPAPNDGYIKERVVLPEDIIQAIERNEYKLKHASYLNYNKWVEYDYMEFDTYKYTSEVRYRWVDDLSEVTRQIYDIAIEQVFWDYWKEKSVTSTYGCVSVYAYALGEARRMIIGQGSLPTNGSMDIKMALQPFVLSGQTGTMFTHWGNTQPDKYEDMLKWMDAAVAGAYWAYTGENTAPQGKFYFFQKLSKDSFYIRSIDAPNSEINKHPCLFNLTDSATNEILSDAVLRYKKFSRSGDVGKLYDGCQGRGL